MVVAKGLSVRETEALAKRGVSPKPLKNKDNNINRKDSDTIALEGDLSANLGLKVEVNHDSGRESGRLMIRYKTLDDLDELCRILTRS